MKEQEALRGGALAPMEGAYGAKNRAGERLA